MRLKETRVTFIAQLIVDQLQKEEYIACDSEDTIIASVKKVIIDDLTVEDRLDEEVRNIIREHQIQLDQKRIEYFQMFRLIKDKLIKERNLII